MDIATELMINEEIRDREVRLIDENGIIVRAFDKVKAADNPAQMLDELAQS